MLGNKIPIRHGSVLNGLRAANALARDILLKTAAQVSVGITTGEVDRYAAAEMKARGCKSAFLGYRKFPGHICISINEEVVHGIGGPRIIQDGDIVDISRLSESSESCFWYESQFFSSPSRWRCSRVSSPAFLGSSKKPGCPIKSSSS